LAQPAAELAAGGGAIVLGELILQDDADMFSARKIELRFAALMLTVGAIVSAHGAEQGLENDRILIGQSNAFSGPLSELGKEYTLGAKAYLRGVNQAGGVNGRKIELISLDDAYDPKKTVENTRALIDREKVFALGFYVGTANTAAVMPILDEKNIPLVGTLSGADSLRPPVSYSRYLFHTKASYSHELSKMVDYLSTVGFSNIAIAYQNNAFGTFGVAAATALMDERHLKPAVSVSIETDGSNVADAAAKLAQASPKAVILIAAGSVAQKLVGAYEKDGRTTQFASLSCVATTDFIAQLGTLSHGVIISQTSPYPWGNTLPITMEYRAAMKSAGIENFGLVSMEGFIAAKVLVAGLQRAGRDLTREKLVAALESLRTHDFGGYGVTYSSTRHDGSSFVELTMINAAGKFVR
jgi:branched-chain amino acid transport system substrate-binding protein